MPDADILIIGAGLAGLTASSILSRAGLDVALLEARDRSGGRVYSIVSPGGASIELGAEFVHGRPAEIFDIVSSSMLDEVRGTQACSIGGKFVECDFFEKSEQIFSRMREHRGPDISFMDFLRSIGETETEDGAWARRYVQGFHAADPEKISLRSLIEDEEREAAIGGDRQYRFHDGYRELLDRLGSTIDPAHCTTHLETVVRSVEWQNGRVAATTSPSYTLGASRSDASTFSAKRALITLPLSILQRGDVTFSPPLATKQPALSQLSMGHVIRLVLCFSTPPPFPNHIDPQRLGFLFSDDEHFPTWWKSESAGRFLLTGWAPFPSADGLSARPPADIAAQGMRSLARILGCALSEIGSRIESWHLHNWQKDPFARGAYSYANVGGAEAWRELAAPLADTLFFAGEATQPPGYSGTVHGAIASGKRAAEEILASL